VDRGIVFGRLQTIADAEEDFRRRVDEFAGFHALADAFKCFYLETVESINTHCRPRVETALSEFFPIFVARINTGFQSLVACERVAKRGYPLHAYTIHRNNFDSVVLTAAALQGHTDFYAIEGVVPGGGVDPDAVKKRRKETEFAVRRLMVGQESGLTPETIERLQLMDTVFDLEVHGARLSFAGASGWLRGAEPLSIVPKFHKRNFALHMNRYVEIAWMYFRLLPAMQPAQVPLPGDWQVKWKSLDELFEMMVAALDEEGDRNIGRTMVEFVQRKFPFSEKSSFPF